MRRLSCATALALALAAPLSPAAWGQAAPESPPVPAQGAPDSGTGLTAPQRRNNIIILPAPPAEAETLRAPQRRNEVILLPRAPSDGDQPGTLAGALPEGSPAASLLQGRAALAEAREAFDTMARTPGGDPAEVSRLTTEVLDTLAATLEAGTDTSQSPAVRQSWNETLQALRSARMAVGEAAGDTGDVLEQRRAAAWTLAEAERQLDEYVADVHHAALVPGTRTGQADDKTNPSLGMTDPGQVTDPGTPIPTPGTGVAGLPPQDEAQSATGAMAAGDAGLGSVLGKAVVDPAGAALGTVADLLIDPRGGGVSHAVVALGGGRQVLVPWEAMRPAEGGALGVPFTASDLAQAPTFDMGGPTLGQARPGTGQ